MSGAVGPPVCLLTSLRFLCQDFVIEMVSVFSPVPQIQHKYVPFQDA